MEEHSILAQSLRRLYKDENPAITVEKITNLYNLKKLTESDYNYILDINQ